MEAGLAKEQREHAALVRTTIGGLTAKLDQKFKAIEAMQVRCGTV